MVRIKPIATIPFFVILVASTALGNNIWSGKGGDNLWNNPANWPKGIPNPAVDPLCQIDGPARQVLIDATHVGGSEARNDEVRVAYKDGTGAATLTVQGGTLRASDRLFIGARTGATGTVVVNNGRVITSLITLGRVGQGIMVLNGGLVDCSAGMVEIGTIAGGSGTLTINDGALKAVRLQGGTGKVELKGGTLELNTLALTGNLSMDIKNGVLVLAGNGDQTDLVEGYAQSGYVTTFGTAASRGGLVVRYDATLDQTLVTADASKINLAKAWGPAPSGQGAPADANLVWKAGDFTAVTQGNDVYFGTDFNAVAAARVGDPMGVYKGRQNANSLDPGELILGRTYYWRVDQIDSTMGEIYKGDVWSFTVQATLVIDNFNGYPTAESIVTAWKQWGSAHSSISTGFSADANALRVELKPEEGVNGEMTMDRDMDLTINGIRSLTFEFASDLNPLAVKDIYVRLSDGVGTASVVVSEGGIVRSAAWGPVDIDLAGFVGVNLAKVKSLTLGVDLNPGNAQSVYVFFDGLRLYPQRCVPGRSLPTDLNGDCVVDEADLAILAEHWLHGTVQVTASQPPDPNTWFTFDVVDPWYLQFINRMDDPNDPNFPLVDAVPSAQVTVEATGGYDGSGAAVFPGDSDPVLGVGEGCVTVNNAGIAAMSGMEFTISLWVYGDPAWQPFDDMVLNISNAARYATQFECPDSQGRVIFSHGIIPRDTVIWSGATAADWAGQWNHYALVKDAAKGIQQIFHNGRLVAEATDAFQTTPATGDMRIGATNQPKPTRPYHGKLDDLRIYGEALSQAGILSLAGASQIEQAPVTPADINQDGIVDQRDKDLLEVDMGKEQLWP